MILVYHIKAPSLVADLLLRGWKIWSVEDFPPWQTRHGIQCRTWFFSLLNRMLQTKKLFSKSYTWTSPPPSKVKWSGLKLFDCAGCPGANRTKILVNYWHSQCVLYFNHANNRICVSCFLKSPNLLIKTYWKYGEMGLEYHLPWCNTHVHSSRCFT